MEPMGVASALDLLTVGVGPPGDAEDEGGGGFDIGG